MIFKILGGCSTYIVLHLILPNTRSMKYLKDACNALGLVSWGVIPQTTRRWRHCLQNETRQVASAWLPPVVDILRHIPLSGTLHVKSRSGCFFLSPVAHLGFLSWKQNLLAVTWDAGRGF